MFIHELRRKYNYEMKANFNNFLHFESRYRKTVHNLFL